MSDRRTNDVGIWADCTPEDFPAVNILSGGQTSAPLDLTALRDIANAATPGPWEDRVDDLTDDVIVVHDLEQVLDVAWLGHMGQKHSVADAAHVAAFDPPTVLALLDRVTAAESSLARYIVERTRFGDAMAASAVPAVVDAIMHELTADSAGAVARVRELHTKQLGGTPSGDFADVCSCGLSYWPCPTIDALDGGA